ncbi:MAG: thiol reductant ABC exporter subunit CydD [Brevundimonas sp.]
MSTADGPAARETRDWLKTAVAPWRRLILLSAGLVILDVVPAVGFAAGLALTIGTLDQGLRAAVPWLLLAGSALVLRGLLGQAALLAAARAAAVVKQGVRQDLLREVFGGRRSGTGAMSAVVEGVETLDGYVSRFSPARTAAALSPLIVIAVCAVASPFVAGILLLTLIPFVAGMALAGTAAAAESRRQFQALEQLSGLFLDRIRALPILLAFQAEARTTAEIARVGDELERRTGRVLKVAFISSGVLEFFSALSVALVAVYCGFNLLRLLPFPAPETLDLTRAFFVLALAPEVYAPMRRLAAAYHERQATEAAVPSLMPVGVAVADPQTAPDWAAPPSLSFRSVTIRYPDGATPVRDFNLDVPAGALIAIVGPSGSGKSSLLHLLLGLAPLSGGAVEAGGFHLGDAGSFAGGVSWAGQAPMLVPGTLSDNIGLAKPGATPEQIMRAAGQAGLNIDLDRLLDERGGGLSGGERRRLGLARAFLKSSPLLLMDEPTANLDAASEAGLIPFIREAARGRTTLVATHSPAVIALADRVVRL